MERLRECRDLDVRLFVVGGEESRLLRSRWYEAVPLPTTGSHVAYPDFVPWLRGQSRAWDIAVAPLQDTPFNHHKSDLKYLEYSALGLPGIFSDVTPYSDSVRHDDTGLLCANTTEAWCAAIVRLAQDAALRERLATAARRYVVGERCLHHDATDYARLVTDVATSRVATD